MKAGSVLVIDAYAVLAFAISTEGFQPVFRGHSEIFEAGGSFEDGQPPASDMGDLLELLYQNTFRQLGSVLVGEESGHALTQRIT